MGHPQTKDNQILYINKNKKQASFVKLKLEASLGQKVVLSTSSLDAIRSFRSQPENFNLVLSNILMPDMTGVELSQKLLKIRSDISIILFTYLGEIVIEKNSTRIEVQEFIRCSSIDNGMLNTVKQVLERKKSVINRKSEDLTFP